jgi:hypothetical protein
MARSALTPIVLPADPVANLQAATKQYVDGKVVPGLTLTPLTTNKTTNYTAAPGEYVGFDLTTGSFNATLPPTPPNGTLNGFRINVLGGTTNTVSIFASSTDLLFRPSGPTSSLAALSQGNQSILFEYWGGIWWQIASGFALANMNAAYQQLSTLTTKGDLYVATASATAARQAVGANGTALIADSSQTNGVAWGAAPRVFASTAARDAAITAPTAGMTCITTDTGSYWQYFTTQGWYRPNTILAHVAIGQTNGITTAGTQIATSGSITVPANRRIICVARVYCEFLNNGGWLLTQMDGGAADHTARINTSTSGIMMYGDVTWNPTAGAHTWTLMAASLSGTMNVRGDQSPSWFQVRDYGPV